MRGRSRLTVGRGALPLLALLPTASEAEAKVTRYLTGSASDVSPRLRGPALDLGRPLTFGGYKVWKLAPGSAFDLARRPRTGFTLVNVLEGKPTDNLY